MPEKIAVTPDGVEHRFPDNTPDDIMDKAIKSYLQPGVAKITNTALQSAIPKDSEIRARTWNDTFNDLIENHHGLISGAVGAGVGLMTGATGVGAPAAGLTGSAAMALVDNYLTGLYKKQGTPLEEATKIGKDTLINEALSGGVNLGIASLPGISGVASGIKGVANEIKKPGSISGTISELKPTYSEYPGAPKYAGFIENIISSGSKRKANEASAKLIEQKAQGVSQSLSGKNYKIGDLYENAYGVANEVTDAWDSLAGHARLRANNVRGVAKVNELAGSGLVDPMPLIQEGLKLKKEIKVPLGAKSGPDKELLGDINAMLKQLNVTQDAAGNITSYSPIDFEKAWASKISYGDKGYSNPKTGQNIVDIRYKRLFNAADNSVEGSIPNWKVGQQQALQNYQEAKAITNYKYQQFMPEGSGDELSSLVLKKQGTKFPTSPVNQVTKDLSDPDIVQRMLNAGSYELNGVKITDTNLKKEAAGYSFMNAYSKAAKMPDPNNPSYMSLDPKKLQANIIEAVDGKAGQKIYNRQTAENIKALATDFSQVDQALDPKMSNYMYFRMTGLGATLGSGWLAGRLGASSVGMVGVMASLNVVGKLMTYPPAAKLLIAAQRGAPLGMSGEAASRIISNALRGQTVELLYPDKKVRGTMGKDGFIAQESNTQ